MSRMQGDAYRTHTDHELNAYRARLDAKLWKLMDRKEKWYRAGEGWVLTEERNRMVNPNGSWKWHGWEVEAHEYRITVFPGASVEVRDGIPHAIGLAQEVKFIDDDKDAANAFFKEACKMARTLKEWTDPEPFEPVFKL